MKNIITALFSIFLTLSVSAANDDVKWVHITGYVNKPGHYKLPKNASSKDILKACGGATAWGTIRRVKVIRLAREANPTMNIPRREKTLIRIFDLRKDKKISLEHNDLIFVPQKEAMGR